MEERQAHIRKLFKAIDDINDFVTLELDKYEQSLIKILWLRVTKQLSSFEHLRHKANAAKGRLIYVKRLQEEQKKDLVLLKTL